MKDNSEMMRERHIVTMETNTKSCVTWPIKWHDCQWTLSEAKDHFCCLTWRYSQYYCIRIWNCHDQNCTTL